MGLIHRILAVHGRGPDGAEGILLRGDGSFPLPIVGESHYQKALAEVTGGPRPEGVDHAAMAELVLEDDNPHDALAVAVLIQGKRVGYLSRRDARRFRGELAGHHSPGMRIWCRARVRGGWSRGPSDRGSFGVWLDTGDANDA